ncbi:MAG: NAD(P)H-dependent oxidoreductase subunit E [Clostridia bacterium]|nr:NAD(P)H-dependent oxidoreductase subunit E [Clostridia bacterium]
MRITVCIGSSCHVKGSRQVVRALQQLIADNKLEDKVSLGGTFCLSNCQKGVCVTVDDVIFSVTPENVSEFFQNNVLSKV